MLQFDCEENRLHIEYENDICKLCKYDGNTILQSYNEDIIKNEMLHYNSLLISQDCKKSKWCIYNKKNMCKSPKIKPNTKCQCILGCMAMESFVDKIYEKLKEREIAR